MTSPKLTANESEVGVRVIPDDGRPVVPFFGASIGFSVLLCPKLLSGSYF